MRHLPLAALVAIFIPLIASAAPIHSSNPGSRGVKTECTAHAAKTACFAGGRLIGRGATEVGAAVRDGRSVTVYVSPMGNDANPGTHSRPLASLLRARDVVRKLNRHMRAGITVYLESGTYRLTRPLVFGPQDSGTNGHTVVWRGAPGAAVVISGAERISGWRLSNASRDIWAAHVPRGLRTRQIYVNGMRASLASGPAPVRLTRTSTGYRASYSVMAHWRNPSAIDFVYTAQLGLMVEPICPVASIRGRTITMAQRCWDNSTRRLNNLVGFGTLTVPSYVENAYELLDQPGQFYLDGRAHRLYYIPRKGQDMRIADVEAPAVQALVVGNGSARDAIHNIAFSNLQFSYATWLQPATVSGFSDMQSNYFITGKHGYETEGLCQFAPHGSCPYGAWTEEPGNVQIAYDRNVSFLDDRFVHLGAAGLALGNGSQHDTILGSVFTDISGNGLEIGGVNLPEATGPSQTRSVTVSENHVYGVGTEYHGGVGILVGYAADSTISHNQIDHVPYTGISLGWGGWPDKRGQAPVANFSHDNVVSDNLVYDFMQVLSDGGGVYTQGITGPSLARGERVTGNVIHDQLAWGRALQSDDGATFVTYSRNVLYNDTYDWGSNHLDYVLNNGSYDPQVVDGNYWQQGDPNSSLRNVTESGNTIIAGPAQAPASIVSQAGIELRFGAVRSWKPPGQSAPNAPERVGILYAFRGKSYVTWRPSFAEGDTGVTSYTVSACRAPGAVASGQCKRPAGRAATISASDFDRLGYAVVSGLRDGTHYAFTVVAANRGGSSTPSIPSAVVTESSHDPSRPGRPKGLDARPGRRLVRLLWYAPSSARRQPVLAYRITGSRGQRSTATGLRQTIVSNSGGRVVDVIPDLLPGRSYRFSVVAVTPGGAGPAMTSRALAPKG